MDVFPTPRSPMTRTFSKRSCCMVGLWLDIETNIGYNLVVHIEFNIQCENNITKVSVLFSRYLKLPVCQRWIVVKILVARENNINELMKTENKRNFSLFYSKCACTKIFRNGLPFLQLFYSIHVLISESCNVSFGRPFSLTKRSLVLSRSFSYPTFIPSRAKNENF